MKINPELCERVRMAALAIDDGEDPGMAPGEIEGHIRSCDGCRRELAGLRSATELLATSSRRGDGIDLWPVLEHSLAAAPERRPAALDPRGLLVAVFLFACYKAIELAAADPAPLLRLAPLAIGAVLFFYLKNNPFRIDSGLRLEGE